MPNCYAFIHLSDIHFGQERGGEQRINGDIRDEVINVVREQVAERRQQGKAEIAGIIVTGDIAYSGKEPQYRAAGEWLAKLAEAAGCASTAVQLVPGNHDIDRDLTGDAAGGLIQRIIAEGEDYLDRVLDNETDRTALYARFREYRRFANGYGCPLDVEGGHAGVKRFHFSTGGTLAIAGLNSALLCTGAEKAGELILGARQRTIPNEQHVEWMVLSHHPLEWFSDGSEANRYIGNRARILVCGHEHNRRVRVDDVPGNGRLMTIDAGATTPRAKDNETYCFNIIDIAHEELGVLDITVSGFTWDLETKRFLPDIGPPDHAASVTERLPCPRLAPSMPEKAAFGRAEAVVEEAAQEPAAREDVMDQGREEQRFGALRLRFFHDLDEADRLRVLVEANALSSHMSDAPTIDVQLMLLEAAWDELGLDALDRIITEAQRGGNKDGPTAG